MEETENLNGKKISGRLKLKVQDIVKLEHIELKILSFNSTRTGDNFPYEKYKEIILKGGPKVDLIEDIENELKKLREPQKEVFENTPMTISRIEDEYEAKYQEVEKEKKSLK